jgi:succinoglycan biosynthesis transport protein ExoP
MNQIPRQPPKGLVPAPAPDPTPVPQLLQPETIDLRHYLNVLLRVKWRLIGTSLAVTMIAALLVFSMTPIYRATTTVLIESAEAKVLSIEEVYGIDSKAKEYFLTQFEIIKSRPIAERVVMETDLGDYPEYAQKPEDSFSLKSLLPDWLSGAQAEKAPNPLKAQVRTYRENLQVAPVRNTQLVNIHFESEDPELAARLANAHAEAYIESTLEAKLAITQSAAEWMSSRLDRLKGNLEESERELQEFRERKQLVDAGGVTALSEREINELTSRLVEARRQLSESRSNYLQTRGISDANASQLDSVPAVIRDPLVIDRRNEVAAAEQRVAELSKRYGPKHPTMIGAVSDLASAQNSLESAVARVIDGIRQEYRVAQSQVSELEAAIESARNTYLQTGRIEGELLELQRAVDTNRQLYDLFYSRMRETSETGDLTTAAARVVSPAVAPEIPSKPKTKLAISLAFLASMFVGFIIALLADTMDNIIRGTQDVEEKLGEALLAAIPLIKTKETEGKAASLAFFDDDEHGFREAIRTIRTGITLSTLDEDHKAIMVTSSLPGDGKSTVAINLSHAYGQIGRTLLIDCDMRRPSLATEYRLPKGQAGLAELMAGSAKLSEVVQEREEEGIHLVCSGALPPNPLEMLSSERFASLIKQLQGMYDHLIIDSPPTLPVSDAAVLSTVSDAVVYVVRADVTTTKQAQQGLKALRAVNAQLIGCVLNGVDVKRASSYGDDYSYYESYT